MERTSDRLYTAAQVRQLDAAAIEGCGITGYELMCRAGRAVFHRARAVFPGAVRWLILCGGGNNGGDGYVVARLAREAGMETSVIALKEPSALSGDAARAAGEWGASGGSIGTWPGDRKPEVDLVVDALLGTGLDREVEGTYREAIDWLNSLECARVAVDVPSGLDADSGAVLGGAVAADLTVTFIGLKRGLFTADGPDHAGNLFFDVLDTPPSIHEPIDDAGHLLDRTILRRHLGRRSRNSHKGTYGHVLVIGGDAGMSGAARMAGEAALRAGAGLVSVATHPDHAAWLNLARPELMVHAAADARALDPLIGRAGVIAVGPGLGQGDWGCAMLNAVLESPLPAVVDADGLNLMGANPPRRGDWVLTPHPAEAARLLGIETRQVQRDRFGSARDLADRTGAVVVLKGCGSVVAEPGGRWSLCPLGNPGMASGGTGDVLTGVIAALLAQGADPSLAARLGVVAHAAAGDDASREGERGMLASDITDRLREVLNG